MRFQRFFSVFSTVISILGMVAMSLGIWFLIDFKGPDDFPNFTVSNCTLVKGQVVNFDKCGYVPMWQNDDSTGSSVLDSPFSMTSSLEEANAKLKVFSLDTSVPCMCSYELKTSFPATFYHSDCNIWGATCYLDTKSVQYIQKVSSKYVELAELLLIFSAITTLISIIITIVTCICSCRNSNGQRQIDNGPLYIKTSLYKQYGDSVN